jgi:hypothetical protein
MNLACSGPTAFAAFTIAAAFATIKCAAFQFDPQACVRCCLAIRGKVHLLSSLNDSQWRSATTFGTEPEQFTVRSNHHANWNCAAAVGEHLVALSLLRRKSSMCLEELTLFAAIGPGSGPSAKLNASTCKLVAVYLAVKGMLERDECPKELVTLRATGVYHAILAVQLSAAVLLLCYSGVALLHS